MRVCKILIPPLLGLLAMLIAGCGGSSGGSGSNQTSTLIVTPVTANLTPGQQLNMLATCNNAPCSNVTWQATTLTGAVIPNVIQSNGTFTAPAATGTYKIIATTAGMTGVAQVNVQAAAGGIGAINPAAATVPLLGTQQFTDVTAGGVSWTVQEGNTGGFVSATGLYSAPALAGIYHVVATSVTSPTQSVVAQVTVPDQIAIQQQNVTLTSGGSYPFTALVTGSKTDTLIWSVQEGAAGGSISAAGVYTAPSVSNASVTYHVIAASTLFPGVSNSVPVLVQPAITTISPTKATVSLLGTQQFTSPGAVIWSVLEGNAGGTINSSGLYAAPVTPGFYHVYATSKTDPTQFTVAVVTVPELLQINPQSVAVSIDGTYTFTVTGSLPADTILWSIVEGNTGGAISSAGVYTAPGATGTFHIIATSSLFPNDASTPATVTVQSGGAIGVIE